MLIADCSSSHRSRIRAALLRWYDREKRDLPWRQTRDPYAIWVSETMLQQTQVAAVVPYYLRFLERLPTVAALARAPLREVLTLWSGLGYYRRAENLRTAAGILLDRYGGEVPCDYRTLAGLPGIGRYTASALMSIAFDKPYAAVDGNARRVYSRLFGLSSAKEIEDVAQRMVSPRRARDYTQAVMELGSTVCVPSTPSCSRCPLAHWCSARRAERFTVFQRPRVETTSLEWPLVFLESQGSVLLHRRPASGLLAGLWELPKPEDLTATYEGLRKTLERRAPIAIIRHAITRHRITAPVYVVTARAELDDASWVWAPLRSLSAYPMSSLSTKAVRAARKELSI